MFGSIPVRSGTSPELLRGVEPLASIGNVLPAFLGWDPAVRLVVPLLPAFALRIVPSARKTKSGGHFPGRPPSIR